MQACVLGALSVLIVDHTCRQPLIDAEPSCATLFDLASNLEGYEDRAWAALRREAAAKAITSLIQRDHEARIQLMMMGGINQVLTLLEAKVGVLPALSAQSSHPAVHQCEHGRTCCSCCTHGLRMRVCVCACAVPIVLQGPGQSKVQNCMAALLATLVLDEQAMEVLQKRGEGHLVFEVALKLVRGNRLRGLPQLSCVQGSNLHQFAAVCDSGQRIRLVIDPCYPTALPCLCGCHCPAAGPGAEQPEVHPGSVRGADPE